jgi:hypothetical protein
MLQKPLSLTTVGEGLVGHSLLIAAGDAGGVRGAIELGGEAAGGSLFHGAKLAARSAAFQRRMSLSALPVRP